MGQPKFVLSNTTQVYSIMFRPLLRPFSHMSTQENIEKDTIESTWPLRKFTAFVVLKYHTEYV
jgi:hypothetical protein